MLVEMDIAEMGEEDTHVFARDELRASAFLAVCELLARPSDPDGDVVFKHPLMDSTNLRVVSVRGIKEKTTS